MLIPHDLKDRTEAAILRITSGQAAMRIPVDPSDPDVVLAEWLRIATLMPAAAADPEVLATVTLGGYFSSEELGDIDLKPVMSALEQIQQDVVRSDDDEHLELVDRAHVTRLQAEAESLRAELSWSESECRSLQADLTKARELNKQLGTEVIQLLTFLEDDFDNLQLENSSLPISTQQWNKVGKLAADTLAHQSAPAAKGGES